MTRASVHFLNFFGVKAKIKVRNVNYKVPINARPTVMDHVNAWPFIKC